MSLRVLHSNRVMFTVDGHDYTPVAGNQTCLNFNAKFGRAGDVRAVLSNQS